MLHQILAVVVLMASAVHLLGAVSKADWPLKGLNKLENKCSIDELKPLVEKAVALKEVDTNGNVEAAVALQQISKKISVCNTIKQTSYLYKNYMENKRFFQLVDAVERSAEEDSNGESPYFVPILVTRLDEDYGGDDVGLCGLDILGLTKGRRLRGAFNRLIDGPCKHLGELTDLEAYISLTGQVHWLFKSWIIDEYRDAYRLCHEYERRGKADVWRTVRAAVLSLDNCNTSGRGRAEKESEEKP